MGPDFHSPDTGIQIPDAYQHADSITKTPPDEQWWRDFNNPELNQAVDEALRNNLNIRKATARILEVQSQFVQTRADRFPMLGVEAKAQRDKRPIIGLLPTGSFTVRTDTHTLSLPASFELDLWGKLARAEEAAQADLLRAEENRRTVVQTIAAETVTLYLRMEAIERRIQITEASIKNFKYSFDLVERRYKRGLSSILDLKQASRILAEAETVLPSLRQELGITQQRISVLLGKYPETRPARAQPEDYFRLLDPVPPGLPSDLLLRRPDIRAAEADLRALNARIGVAKASRFPRITLTGSFGYSSEELNMLFEPESELWSVASGVTQPLFDAGRLKAGQQAAEARYEQGLSQYAQTVLMAFSEVETALLTRKEQIELRNRVLKFLKDARAVQDFAQTRYRRGLTDYLTVLESQRTRFLAEEKLVLVDLAILSNRVSLYRALGTGWEEKDERRTRLRLKATPRQASNVQRRTSKDPGPEGPALVSPRRGVHGPSVFISDLK
jgi:multidrug efflux system outer membrane protein